VEGEAGQAGTASRLREDGVRYQAWEFVSFVPIIRSLLTSMQKSHARARQQT